MSPANVLYVVQVLLSYASLQEAMTQAPEALAAHLARSQELHAGGTLLLAGAFLDESAGSLTTMAVLTTHEAAEDYIQNDPFVILGKVKEWSIREWANMFA